MDESTPSANIGVSSDGIYLPVLDNLLEACQVLGFDWRYRYLNHSAVRQNRKNSRDDMLGQTMMEVYPGIETMEVFAVFRRCMEQRVPGQIETDFTFPDGTLGWFEVRCEPVQEGMFILSIDTTERKRAEANLRATEEQLRQSQKMEAIGRLAAGVAHDFNNLLTIITLSCDLLLHKMPASSQQTPILEQIRDAGDRATTLTRQLLAFSRQQVLEPVAIDLNAITAGMEKMLQRLIGENISLETRKAADLGTVMADVSQVEQVMLNLAINARDAMPDGGTLLIETSNVELDSEYAETHVDVQPGHYVMLAVSDTGSGMDKVTQERIFEPFFTTKSQGRGTGLGLATVFGIVRQSGGFIWVYSEPGHGSTFKVYLPRIDGSTPTRTEPPPTKNQMGGETILLVEDDEQVRGMTALSLQLVGYNVLQTGKGRDAVAICEKHPGPIHLLICDVIMPNMSGRKVAESIETLRPGVKVLYVSGYTDDAVVRHGIEVAKAAFLQKPFTPDSLAQKVREVLDKT